MPGTLKSLNLSTLSALLGALLLLPACPPSGDDDDVNGEETGPSDFEIQNQSGRSFAEVYVDTVVNMDDEPVLACLDLAVDSTCIARVETGDWAWTARAFDLPGSQGVLGNGHNCTVSSEVVSAHPIEVVNFYIGPDLSESTSCLVASVCDATCATAGDGECDDGGPGSLYNGCDLGTDCADCGARVP